MSGEYCDHTNELPCNCSCHRTGAMHCVPCCEQCWNCGGHFLKSPDQGVSHGMRPTVEGRKV